jgi:hypothetical protein
MSGIGRQLPIMLGQQLVQAAPLLVWVLALLQEAGDAGKGGHGDSTVGQNPAAGVYISEQ